MLSDRPNCIDDVQNKLRYYWWRWNSDIVLAASDEDQKIAYENYHKKLLHRQLAWDKFSYSKNCFWIILFDKNSIWITLLHRQGHGKRANW